MASGASESGDDMVVGRTNESDERTLLVAINGDNAPGGYGEDFVLSVSTANDQVLRSVPDGVDAIHAVGTVDFPTGGAIGTLPAGNGVVARGANGVVGYVHGVTRDKAQENDVRAGVFGLGGTAADGVLGRGVAGVVGYAQGTARNAGWEASTPTGVCGRGDTGVRGTGENGPGVRGDSSDNPGLFGISDSSAGVSGLSTSGFGVYGESTDGPGLFGSSVSDRAAMLNSQKAAQLWLVPQGTRPLLTPSPITPTAIPVVPERHSGPDLPRDGRGGDLIALEDEQGTCTLWFCVNGRGPVARWAQVLLGQPFDGTA